MFRPCTDTEEAHINPLKFLIKSAAHGAGYDIVRVAHHKDRRPTTGLVYPDLSEYADLTERIPGMIATESGALLYALCRTQDLHGDVLEIGSWKGRSTAYLGLAARDSRNGRVFAVDHFRGNVGGASSVDGPDETYRVFTQNMMRLELQDVVTVLPLSSEDAHVRLTGKNFRFIFIDGDHSEVGVSRDIDLFTPMALPNALVMFDDFDGTSPGVVNAVETWVRNGAVSVLFRHRTAIVCRVA